MNIKFSYEISSWISFWLIFFWFTVLLFLISPNYFITLLFFSELTWVILYLLIIIVGSLIDDASLTSLSFFIFALAGLEFSLGFMIIIIFRSFNISLYFSLDLNKKNDINFKNTNKLYSKKRL